jgi:hypothetical protein
VGNAQSIFGTVVGKQRKRQDDRYRQESPHLAYDSR